MEDNFEKFIKAHKAAFDVHEPRRHLWTRIYKKIRSRNNRWMAVAVSILLLAVSGAVWWSWTQEKGNGTVNPYRQPEQYYASLISEKRNELNAYCKGHDDICLEFKSDLDALDSMYTRLKSELNTSPDREAVLQAMISNLKIQLEILTRQLQIIRSIEQRQKDTLTTKI